MGTRCFLSIEGLSRATAASKKSMSWLSIHTCLLQVLQGLETYITTEKFLHTLEAASAEWIDLSDHQQHPHKGWSPPSSNCELELQEVGVSLQALHAARLSQHKSSSSCVATCKGTPASCACTAWLQYH